MPANSNTNFDPSNLLTLPEDILVKIFNYATPRKHIFTSHHPAKRVNKAWQAFYEKLEQEHWLPELANKKLACLLYKGIIQFVTVTSDCSAPSQKLAQIEKKLDDIYQQIKPDVFNKVIDKITNTNIVDFYSFIQDNDKDWLKDITKELREIKIFSLTEFEVDSKLEPYIPTLCAYWYLKINSQSINYLIIGNKFSLLHVYTAMGYEKGVEYLLLCGADVNIKSSKDNNPNILSEFTPIVAAMMFGRTHCIELLFKYGAQIKPYNYLKHALEDIEADYSNVILDVIKILAKYVPDFAKDIPPKKMKKLNELAADRDFPLAINLLQIGYESLHYSLAVKNQIENKNESESEHEDMDEGMDADDEEQEYSDGSQDDENSDSQKRKYPEQDDDPEQDNNSNTNTDVKRHRVS